MLAILAPMLLVSGCYFGHSGTTEQQAHDADASGDDPAGPEPEQAQTLCEDGPSVGRSSLRRLTRTQYANTVRDLLGIETPVVAAFPPDDRIGAFASNSVVPVSELALEKYREAAEDVAAQATDRLASIAPCDGGDPHGCADDFIADFGARAYRRPLTPAEHESLLAAYETGADNGGYEGGIRLVIATALQSPNFLYLFEFGEGPTDGEGLIPLTPWELASRLSYTLWNSMPDNELFAAAERGALGSSEELEEQARRMLEDERALAALVDFHMQWFGVDGLDASARDGEHFPEWSEARVAAMRDEFAEFVSYVFAEESTLEALLTAPYAFPGDELLETYGADASEVDEDGLLELAPERRSGILTLPAVMATHAHRDRTSPVHRGLLVRQQLLCQIMPPPPPGVSDSLPLPEPGMSEQDLLRQHRENPECTTCHELIDPLGFTFEHYDALGRFRQHYEAGETIDASGELFATDVDGPIDGVPDLAARLVESEQVQACVVEQWFRYAFGRPSVSDDACSKDAAVAVLVESQGDLHEMLVALVTADAFRFRRIESQ